MISAQHCSYNAASDNADSNTLDVTYFSLTMTALPWFGVVGDFFALYLLTRKIFSLYRLCLPTLHSLNIMLLLVMAHIYMMMNLTVSLKNLLFQSP